MATTGEFPDIMSLKIIELIRNNLLDNLDPELRKKLTECKGDIVFDFPKNTFTVQAASEELEKAIIADLKSKR